tara:strand:- start:81 stop:365 length:285 start_codon:yes stop_codon:yes gene_type:complete
METTKQHQPGATSATTAQTGKGYSMSVSSSFSVVRSVGRFGDVFFNVVDADGWTVECYLQSEGGEADATEHAATGRRPSKCSDMSREVAAMLSR